MQTMPRSPLRRRAEQLGICLCLCLAGASAAAHDVQHHGQTPSDAPNAARVVTAPPGFIASTAKPFSELMNDAMAVMDDGMQRAPMNGQTDHDFIEMMLPHHQGAVDMAKAVLLYTKDPEIRNIALGIITEQQTEIHVMQAWLKNQRDKPAR